MAKPKGYIPSEEDARRLKEMSDELRRLPRNLKYRHPPQDDGYTTDVYAAKVPEGGIRARQGVFPGCAVCEIYRLYDSTGEPDGCLEEPTELVAVLSPAGDPFKQRVYNLSPKDVPEGYIPISRERYGRWIIGQGGGDAGVIVSTIMQDTCGKGDIVPIDPVSACGEIVDCVCNAAGVPGTAGQTIIAMKQVQCEDSSGSDGSERFFSCGEGPGNCTPTGWVIITMEPSPLCPLSDVEDRGTHLVQVRSEMYGYKCGGRANAEIITPISDCEEGSGAESDDNLLAAEWNLFCPDDSGGE